MQLPGQDTEIYYNGCCALGVFTIFLPMFIGIAYSFGWLKRKKKAQPDDPPPVVRDNEPPT
jgi:hypothetical protein